MFSRYSTAEPFEHILAPMHLTHHVKAPLETVYAHLAQAKQFVSIHPLIYKAEPMPDGRYRLYERLPIGPFSLSFTYPACFLGAPGGNSVSMQATIFGLVTVELLFKLVEAAGQTIVDEHITFKTWLPIEWAMQPIFKKQHNQMFAQLELKTA